MSGILNIVKLTFSVQTRTKLIVVSLREKKQFLNCKIFILYEAIVMFVSR
jgi:hypothetical protein